MANVSDIKLEAKFDTLNINYSYTTSFWNGTYTQDLSPSFSTAQEPSTIQSALNTALRQWDSYSVFNFRESTNGEGNLHIFSANTLTNTLGDNSTAVTGYFVETNASSAKPVELITSYTRADIAIDNTNSYFPLTFNGTSYVTNPNYLQNYVSFVALHEIGHALGLDGDATISGVGGFTSDMSIMSYNIPNSGFSIDAQGNGNYSSFASGRFAVTPMAYDIAAIEEKYGANTVNAGDTVYNRMSTVGGELIFDGTNKALTIQDTGGYNTISLAGTSWNNRIDINEAINAEGNWTSSPSIINGQQYVYIARGTDIHEVIGGDGNDSIVGNDLDNRINGGGGNDSLDGCSGDDILEGGTGDDSYLFSGAYGRDVLTDADGLGSITIGGTVLLGTATIMLH